MKKPSPKTVFMQNIWPLEPPWLPETLENQHQGGSCTTRDLYGSVCSHTKFEVYQKTKLSLFQFWLLFHLILLMLVSHQAYFSLCLPLKSLNFLDLSTSFYLRLPRRFAYCSIPWREQPLESLDRVTATLLFQGHLVTLKWATLCRCYLALGGKNSPLPQNLGPLPMLAVLISLW